MRTLFPLNATLARMLIPWFVKRGISANQITWLSLLAGMAGALAFLEGTRAGMIWGALGFFAANLLDECDGSVARATGTSSGFGSWLDTLAGCAVHAIFFASLGFGLSRQSLERIWYLLGMLAGLSVVIATVAYVVEQGVSRGRSGWRHPDPPRPDRPDRMEWLRGALRTDFSLVVLAATVTGGLRWLLWGGLLGAFLFWIPADFLAAARLRRTEPERLTPPPARPPKADRWKWIGLGLGAALFAAVLAHSDLKGVWSLLIDFRWRFGMVFLFYIVIFGLDTLGWKFALRPKVQSRIPWSRLFRVRLVGEAVNYITPTASIGGEPVKAWILSRRHGVPMQEGMASVVIAKTTFTFSMLLFVVIGLAVALATQPSSSKLMAWVWVMLPGLSGLAVLFVLVQFLQPFRRFVQAVSRWMPERLRKAAERVHEWDREIVSFYRQSPGSVLWSLGFHFLGWLAGAVEVYLILHFLNLPVSWATAFSLEALWVLLRSGAFLIPASLGASEGFLLLVCGALGLSAVPGLALGLIRRAREVAWTGLGLLEFSRDS